MIPSREKAEQLLQEGLQKNPGPWGDHSKTAAHCAEKIAAACGDLDPEKAYVLGLLHDIGRTFGVRHLGHVSDGYSYMKKIGCDEVAKVCLTHSFATQTLEEYIGKYDVSEDELSLIRTELEKSVYDDYDRLVQLCDSIAGAEGVLDIEERMLDVKGVMASIRRKNGTRISDCGGISKRKWGGMFTRSAKRKLTIRKSAERTTTVGKNSPTGDKNFFQENLCV